MGGNFVNQQKENCMKNNIFKIIIFFLALVSLGACDDGCEDYLDQYESILYFKNNGEQHVTIYDTSNEASCEFTVIRAGYNSKKYSTVDVSVLDAVNIQIYNAENETDYKLLPDNCFKLETPTLAFEDTDNHKKVKAFFYIDKIKELDKANYILPLVLNNSSDDINIDKRQIFIVPDIVTPYLYFEKSGYQPYKAEEGGETSFDITIPISMPMENNWDFDCTLKINPELLTAYNETNHADFELLPDNCYSLAEKVSFVSGKSTSIATVKINIPDDLKFGKYMLPIELSECSMPTFDIKEGTNTYLAGIVYQKLIDKENIEERTLPVNLLKYLLSDIRNTLLKARFALPQDADPEAVKVLDERFNEHLTFKLCEDLALSLCNLFGNKEDDNTLSTTIEKYINDNYKDPSLGLNKISDEFQISESYFSHMFKEKTGVNFSTYLENIRMTEAARLIQETDISLNELYIAVGYNNSNTFRRAFKKVYGVTPSAMREK